MDFHVRKRWFAGIALAVGVVIFLFSGFTELAILGIALTGIGFADFLFAEYTHDGQIASDVYGDPGEELWEFRSFILMVGGPMLILYSIVFG